MPKALLQFISYLYLAMFPLWWLSDSLFLSFIYLFIYVNEVKTYPTKNSVANSAFTVIFVLAWWLFLLFCYFLGWWVLQQIFLRVTGRRWSSGRLPTEWHLVTSVNGANCSNTEFDLTVVCFTIWGLGKGEWPFLAEEILLVSSLQFTC